MLPGIPDPFFVSISLLIRFDSRLNSDVEVTISCRYSELLDRRSGLVRNMSALIFPLEHR